MHNLSVDLNCDMGESFGPWKMGNDEEILKYVSSANIACGFHAGDPATISRTIHLAKKHGVAVGAHPGFPDLTGFGRRTMDLTAKEVFDLILYQISAVYGVSKAKRVRLHHVKPHGALYNQAAKDKKLAEAISDAVASLDNDIVLYGLSGSYLISEAKKKGLKTASEVFSDRTYSADGSLTPRSQPGAMIENPEEALTQVLNMVIENRVRATDGSEVEINAETICIHGDGKHAVEFAKMLHKNLKQHNVEIEPV